MTNDVFFDTNVLVYVLTADALKADRSEALIRDGGIVSVQVLNECAHVLRRKFAANWDQINLASRSMREACGVVGVSEDVHERGLAYAQRYKLQIYDAMIVAAAVLAGCTTLYSEDMHDGLVIDGLTIKNPFAVA